MIDQIKFEEQRLFTIIENKIIQSIQNLCQWRFHNVLRDTLQLQEKKHMEESLYPRILEELKEYAPLHYQYLSYQNYDIEPLGGIYRPTYLKTEYQYDKFRDNGENSHKISCWPLITYNDLQQHGFSKDFSKRVIDKYINEYQLKSNRWFGGYSYMVSNTLSIKNRIKYAKIGIEITHEGFEIFNEENWIYEKFVEKELKKIFEEIREDIFLKL